MVSTTMILITLAALCAIGSGYITWRTWHNDRLIPIAPVAPPIKASISVIIPARNEEDNLKHLLPTLQTQTCMPAEIIVVDDDSSDATADLAAAMGARVLSLLNLPSGWAGKAHACHIGAQSARGEWLLFVDADVRLAPDAVASALAAAERQGTPVLSALLNQECDSPLQRLMIPFAYAQYWIGAPARRHFDAAHAESILNGQFILFKRSLYMETGGFALVRGAVMEDLALGRALKQKGYRVGLVHGEAWGRVRMYRSPGDFWRGFSKTALTALSYNPRGGLWTVTTQMLTCLLPPLLAACILSANLLALTLALIAFLAGALQVAYWDRRYRVSIGYALLYPIATIIMTAIAFSALLRQGRGHGVEWKGRTIRA
ncbi:MAG: glycosyltransferase [Anaerolineae bacterium]